MLSPTPLVQSFLKATTASGRYGSTDKADMQLLTLRLSSSSCKSSNTKKTKPEALFELCCSSLETRMMVAADVVVVVAAAAAAVVIVVDAVAVAE
jgi:hypothetical protein